MPKMDLKYTPLEFPEGKSPAFEFVDFGEDGIGIQIEQPNGWRTFLVNGLAYIYQQERAQVTGHDNWVADRLIDINRLISLYKHN